MFSSARVAPMPISHSGRGLGALAMAALLAGTAVLAPLSLPTTQASALPHHPATVTQPTSAQSLTSAPAAETPLDLRVDIVENGPKKPEPQAALFSLDQFMFQGSINWGGYRFTYYSQQVLPGGGLVIPGRHVSDAGYVTDAEGYIVLAGSAPKGTVYETPFGAPGKIYDRGTVGNHLDVYIR